MDGDDEEAQRSLEGLKAAVGYIRREVAENLHLRRPPELYFHLDRSDQYGARIDELLSRTRRKKKMRSSAYLVVGNIAIDDSVLQRLRTDCLRLMTDD